MIFSKHNFLHLSKNLCFYFVSFDPSSSWFQLFPIKNKFDYKLKLFLFRPLLFSSRLNFQKISFFWKVPVFPDKTNTSLTLRRNITRRQILPIFRFFYNRQIDKVLLQFADILSLEQSFLNSSTDKLCNQKIKKTRRYCKINTFFLQSLPIALQRKVLRKLLKEHTNKKNHFVVIESLAKLSASINKKERLAKKLNTFVLKNFCFVFCPGNGAFLIGKKLINNFDPSF